MTSRPSRTRRLLGTALLIAATGGTAVAAPNPPVITGGPADGGYTNADPVEFSWQSGGGGNGAFGWAVDGALPDLTAFVAANSASLPGLDEGKHRFVVAEGPAADDPDQSPASAERTFTVDRTPPSISGGLQGPAGKNGWFVGNVTRTFDCSDNLAVASCPGDETRTAQGEFTFPARTATDKAGNQRSSDEASIAIDKIAPTVPPPGFSPALNSAKTFEMGSGTLTLAWSGACSDGTSGIAPDTCRAYFSADSPNGPWVDKAPGDALDVGNVNGGADEVGSRWIKTEAEDIAGNVTRNVVRYVVQDTLPPSKPLPSSPSPLGVVKDRTPTFTWMPSVDQGTGVDHYELVVDSLAPQRVEAACGQECVWEWPAQLSVATHSWKVRAVDHVGKSIDSDVISFRIDPNAPDPPTLTAGPRGFTNVAAPSFTFTGFVGNTFTWSLWDPSKPRTAGSVPLQGGTSKAGQASLTALPDGQYVFEVTQTGENTVTSPAATAAFTVDTKAPAVPQITSAPGTTANTQPTFAWSGAEAGATFRWRVTSPVGETRLGPGTVSTSSVALPAPLPGGSYQFRVQQVDQAGNESGWSAPEPFTVVAPASSAPPPSGTTSVPGTPSSMIPATKNAKALLPRAGVALTNLRPLLKWKRTRGATLYNVQVYKITTGGLIKVLSVFPKANQYRMVPGVLKKSTRYTWRVWPYLGKKKRYTAAPIGTSWFDVSAKAVNPRLKPKKKVVTRTATGRATATAVR